MYDIIEVTKNWILCFIFRTLYPCRSPNLQRIGRFCFFKICLLYSL